MPTMVNNSASVHKTNNIDIFPEILNLEEHQNCCVGAKGTTILLNWWILLTGGVTLGMVCPYKLAQQACLESDTNAN